MNSYTQPLLRIVVLAAGFSARLGEPKALARVHGTSLLRNTIRLLAPLGTSEIIVVLPPRAMRARAELRSHSVTFVENSERANGLSTSVRRGLAAARASAAILLLPVDLVHLKGRDLDRMITRWRGARRRVIARRLTEHGAVGAARSGSPLGGTPLGGIPLILPHWLCSRALAQISGDRGLKELIAQLPPAHVELLELPSAAWDVDTLQDLERARRRMRLKVS